jgi:hypothetical protein
MSEHRESSLYDRDLDIPTRRPAVVSRDEIFDYQRLWVSPLPMLFGGLAGIYLIRLALRDHHLLLFLSASLLIAVTFPLFQYVCRDCGAIDWYFRRDRHACDAVMARFERGMPNRTFWTARRQLKLWVYAVLACLFIYLVLGVVRL